MLENLNSFTGTEHWYRYSPLFHNVLITDGVKYVADEAGAYWLADLISSHLASVKDGFAIAQLKKRDDDEWDFFLVDDLPPNDTYAYQRIAYSDFPLEEIKLYVIHDGQNWTILLPSEY